MNDRRIIFVNRFYWPDEPATAQLLTDLAEALAGSGFSTTVIARRSPGVAEEEMRNGVSIRRVAASAWGKRSLLGRAVDFGSFLLRARRKLGRLTRPGDVVVTMTDPPMLGPALMGVIRARQAYWIQWLQDIFPEVATEVSGRRAANLFRPWRNRSLQAMRHAVVPGSDMATFLIAQGAASDRVTVCPNWAPAGVSAIDATEWKRERQLDGKFVVLYSGNLGRAHDFDAIVPLAEKLKADPEIVLVFAGDGAQRNPLEQRCRAAGCANVRFLPASAREQLSEALSAGDLHLVTLRRGCERLVFPSKLYGIAAVERPALVIGPANCEVGRIVREHGFGESFLPQEIDGMAQFISRLKADTAQRAAAGNAALRYSLAHGRLEHALGCWRRVLAKRIPLAARSESPTHSSHTP